MTSRRKSLTDLTADPGPVPDLFPARTADPDDTAPGPDTGPRARPGAGPTARTSARASARPGARTRARPDARPRVRADAGEAEPETPKAWRRVIEIEARRYAAAAARLAERDADLAAAVAAAIAAGADPADIQLWIKEAGATGGQFPPSSG